MSWVSATDTGIMSGTEQVKVHFAQSCTLNPSFDQVSQAIAAAGSPDGGGSISSVADVSTDITASLLNPLSILTTFYVATINPVDGASYGQLRSDVLNGLTALAQSSGISCRNFTVGLIEFDDGAGVLATAVCGPGGCGVAGKTFIGLGLTVWVLMAGLALFLALKFL